MKEGKEKWFSRAKLGMFIHWGLYSLLGRGEWVMKRDGLPADEYAKLAERWNPDKNAADAWCKAARDAGMNYAVFTTVHHDGFALFDTRTDSFNSMNTPAHRDHVTEFVEACRKYGLRIGLYYSLVDWRYSEPGGDFIRMKELAYGQLRELMTNYGQIDMLWYDGSWAPDMKTPDAVVKFWEPEKLNSMVRSLQPEILINDRCGRKEDFCTIEGRNIIRRPEGAVLWESCHTLGDDDFSNWGYCRHTAFKRTQEQVIMLVLHALEQGGNELLNVSPDEKGIIPGWQLKLLEGLGKWVGANGEAVYSTDSTEIARSEPKSLQGNSCGFFTAKEDNLYYCLYAWPGNECRIPYLNAKIQSVNILRTGETLPFHVEESGAFIVGGLPDEPPDRICSVLKMKVLSGKIHESKDRLAE